MIPTDGLGDFAGAMNDQMLRNAVRYRRFSLSRITFMNFLSIKSISLLQTQGSKGIGSLLGRSYFDIPLFLDSHCILDAGTGTRAE